MNIRCGLSRAAIPSVRLVVRRTFITGRHIFDPQLCIVRNKVQVPFARKLSGATIHKEVVPSLGDSITDAVVATFTKNVGDFVKEDDVIAVLETDKVSSDLRVKKQGKITALYAKVGDTVKVGQEIIEIDTSAVGDAVGDAKSPKAPKAETAKAPTVSKPSPAAPAAASAAPPAAAPSKADPVPKATPSVARKDFSVPLSRMRLTIANRLKEAQNTAALLTTFQEIDMKNLMDLRAKYKDDFEAAHGVKMGFMSAFVKASSAALLKSPSVNAFFDLENKCITYRDYVDISVAVATPTGLVVPVLRNCHNMSFADVESSIMALGKKARAGQIALEDMVGGTFTISNGGVYGSLMGTPIINPPQSAILGMHGIFKRPVAVDDQVVIRPMMYIALTYDHRIIDGKDAVTFLRDIKFAIEDPARLLLQL